MHIDPLNTRPHTTVPLLCEHALTSTTMELDREDTSVPQHPDMLEPDHHGDLWRLPVKPIFVSKRPMLKDRGIIDLNTRDYHQYCSNLARKWNSRNPEDWLPAILHKNTPYTFTLLLQLPKLARAETRERAHKLLVQVWQAWLIERLDVGGGVDSTTSHDPSAELNIYNTDMPEPFAKGHHDGLRARDVLKATRIALQESARARKEAVGKVNKGNAREILGRIKAVSKQAVAPMISGERTARKSQVRAAKRKLGLTKVPKRNPHHKALAS